MKHEELAIAYPTVSSSISHRSLPKRLIYSLQYGNNATARYRYSAAAILVIVPPWSPERGEGGDGTATFSDADTGSSAGKCSSISGD
jgi:hypothetical protein